MKKESVVTDKAPPAIGPYSQAIIIGDMIFCSGQLGIDPSTRHLVKGVTEQADQALRNLAEVLKAAGSSLGDVVKITVYLASITDFKDVNEVYAKHFAEPYPARAAFAVKDLPLGGLVEIEAIAVKQA